MAFANAVALRKESVDRNSGENIKRRLQHVALRKESVDRNYKGAQIWTYWQVALRKESVDRNAQDLSTLARESTSLSARRAWIEIFYMGI